MLAATVNVTEVQYKVYHIVVMQNVVVLQFVSFGSMHVKVRHERRQPDVHLCLLQRLLVQSRLATHL